MLRSLEQERAKYAWYCINEIKREEDNNLEDKYKSYVKKAPSYILVNGLGNTLAFFKSKFGGSEKSEDKEDKKANEDKKVSKDKEAYEALYNHINKWFQKRFKAEEDILEWITLKASSIDVFKVTKETIALLNWMRRFAEAELKGGK